MVNFKGERDPNQGLESLVNRYFHSLFPEFPESNTVLFPENRLFKTKGPEGYEGNGVCGIPDALMLLFRPDKGGAFSINLIEYECYGQAKYRAVDRFNYLNGHIIPQLIRFASAFSVVADKGMRDNTVAEWTDKLMKADNQR
ncbi:MAG: hypothetical protein N2315_02185 [Thermanaerothrix sp.]|nr:hypothetical protein [Thermanaerothrix sp.]